MGVTLHIWGCFLWILVFLAVGEVAFAASPLDEYYRQEAAMPIAPTPPPMPAPVDNDQYYTAPGQYNAKYYSAPGQYTPPVGGKRVSACTGIGDSPACLN